VFFQRLPVHADVLYLTTHIITAYSLNLPANTRVGSSCRRGFRASTRASRRGCSARQWRLRQDTVARHYPEQHAPALHDQSRTAGHYALVLEYSSDVTVFNPDHGATITPSISTLSGQFTVLVCPSKRFRRRRLPVHVQAARHRPANGTAYRDVGPYRVYSKVTLTRATRRTSAPTRARGRSIRFRRLGHRHEPIGRGGGPAIQVNTAAPRMNLIYPSGDEGPSSCSALTRRAISRAR